MRISTIIPVFNCERFLGDALDSVLEQTRKIDEIIVINDGSTDKTASILADFEDHIRIIHQSQLGGAAAMNAGLEIATGDVLTFLDADDLWTPDKTALQVSALEMDPSIDAVFGMVRQFIDTGTLTRSDITLQARPPQPGVGKISMMIWKSAFYRVGLFDQTLRTVDFVQWYTRAVALPIRSKMLDGVVAFRRLHDANTGRLRRAEQAKENLQSLRTMLALRRSK